MSIVGFLCYFWLGLCLGGGLFVICACALADEPMPMPRGNSTKENP